MRASQSGLWARRTQTGRSTVVWWEAQRSEKSTCRVLGLWSSDSSVVEGRQRSKLGLLHLCPRRILQREEGTQPSGANLSDLMVIT